MIIDLDIDQCPVCGHMRDWTCKLIIYHDFDVLYRVTDYFLIDDENTDYSKQGNLTENSLFHEYPEHDLAQAAPVESPLPRQQ